MKFELRYNFVNRLRGCKAPSLISKMTLFSKWTVLRLGVLLNQSLDSCSNRLSFKRSSSRAPRSLKTPFSVLSLQNITEQVIKTL